MNIQKDADPRNSVAGLIPAQCAACVVTDCAFRDRAVQAGKIRLHTLERGQALQCPEGSCLRFWIVVSGTAGICTYFRDGRRQILSMEERGAAICGLMVSEDSEQRLEALTPCTICDIDLNHLAADLRNDAEFLSSVSRMLHDRLEKNTSHLSTLGRLDSLERVTYFLADMVLRNGSEGGLVTLPMSREDIADYLGLNSDSVSRLLTRVRKSGLVRFVSPTEYFVPDLGLLSRRLPVTLPEPVGTT